VGVAESDTDTMSCCDDSSPDNYHPIGSHHFAGANLQKTVHITQNVGNSGGIAQCSSICEVITQQTGGVAHNSVNSGSVVQQTGGATHSTASSGDVIQHVVVQRGGVAGQQFQPSLSDDEELDKLFASVEVCVVMNVYTLYGAWPHVALSEC